MDWNHVYLFAFISCVFFHYMINGSFNPTGRSCV